MGLVLSKANPLFRQNLRGAPGHPIGAICFVLPLPVTQSTEGGLVKPDVAQERTFGGILLAAGDDGADKLYDRDCRIGDEVWYRKFSGLIEEWQRIVKDGEVKDCAHDSVWEFVPRTDRRWGVIKLPDMDMELRSCRGCGALKLSQRMIAIDASDILWSVDAQIRLETGVTRRVREQDADGRTRYVIVREKDFVDTFETGKGS